MASRRSRRGGARPPAGTKTRSCASSASLRRKSTACARAARFRNDPPLTMETVSDPAFWGRLQLGFTVPYHYFFPHLAMGLAWFLVYWKWRALRTGDPQYDRAVRFWAKIFGLNFAVGVV